jgi:aspartyl-tRNA(Asn)/glutamyl-tRNA(Gln) amidotransferase subunit A
VNDDISCILNYRRSREPALIEVVDDEALAYASIAELGPRLRRREVSPVEVTRACLERIEQLDQRINAFITVLGEAALEEARTAEREIGAGSYRGPLHGIPVAHKDLYYTRGIRTTAGSKVLADFVPDEDATVVARWREAGTVLLGKLNMHEFAAGGTNDNPHYGPVHNPWKHGYHPGGSSGGSGAALAAGMCFAATGSDTAGSIRIPSHCCGTTGIKPTYGRVSCYGVLPLSWSLDHAGPMARSVHDTALLLNAMAGFDRRDMASVDRPTEDFTAQLDHGVKGLRVAVSRNYFNEQLQPDVEKAWRTAIDVLIGLGAEPVEVEFRSMHEAVTLGMTILRAEMRAFHRDWFAQRPQDYSPALHDRFASVEQLSAAELAQALHGRERIRADLWAAFDQADVLLTPTMPLTATPIESLVAPDARTDQPSPADVTRCTYPFNLSGFPALSVPCGFDNQGLPIGLQIGAPAWHEALALRVGHAYQQATDWHHRRPPALAVARIAS